MTLDDAIHRMMTCAPVTGWCPRENECFLVAGTLHDYQKTLNALEEPEVDEIPEEPEIAFYAPEVGFFLTRKPDFEFE